jgi:hypothetical protein
LKEEGKEDEVMPQEPPGLARFDSFDRDGGVYLLLWKNANVAKPVGKEAL